MASQKQQLQRNITDQVCVVKQIQNGNQVVINRYKNLGYNVYMLINEVNNLIEVYNNKYGKRFGNLNTL